MTKQAVQPRLDGEGQLLYPPVDVILIGLGSATDETKGKTALVGGLVAAKGLQGNVGQLLLLVGLPPIVSPRRDFVQIRYDRSETTRSEFCPFVDGRHAKGPCLVDRLRRVLFLGHPADGNQ